MGPHHLWGQREPYDMNATGALVLNPLFVSPVLGSLTPPPSSFTYAFVDSDSKIQLSMFAEDFRETLKDADTHKINFFPSPLPPVNAMMIPRASAAFLKL